MRETRTARAALCIGIVHWCHQSSPVRIDVNTAIRPRRPSGSATARSIGCPALLEAHGVGRPPLRRLQPGRLAPARRTDAARARRRRRADPDPRRRALQEPAVGGAHLRRADQGRRRPRQRASSPSAAASLATRRALPPRPTCAASRWCRCRRRCWRRSTARWAARSASTSRVGKNLVGAFHQPAVVVIDPLLLQHAAATRVPLGPVRSGEVRHDRQPLALRPDRAATPARSSPAIRACWCRRSSSRAASRRTSSPKDERESGLRRILNLRPHVGHALEAVTKYRRFRHGEAIAYGMLGAADLAVARGALAERERQALATADRAARPSAAGRRPAHPEMSWRRSGATRRSSTAGCTSCIAIEIGATMTVDDVTEEELRATLKRLGLDDHASSGPGTP